MVAHRWLYSHKAQGNGIRQGASRAPGHAHEGDVRARRSSDTLSKIRYLRGGSMGEAFKDAGTFGYWWTLLILPVIGGLIGAYCKDWIAKGTASVSGQVKSRRQRIAQTRERLVQECAADARSYQAGMMTLGILQTALVMAFVLASMTVVLLGLPELPSYQRLIMKLTGLFMCVVIGYTVFKVAALSSILAEAANRYTRTRGPLPQRILGAGGIGPDK